MTACGDMRKGNGMAEAAIVEFHKQFNEGKHKEIYAAAHPEFKTSTTEADFLALLQAMQRKLGKHVKAADAGWMLTSFNGQTSIKLNKESEFEQGKGKEAFTYAVSGDSCTLHGYNIQSKEMMLK